MSRTDAPLDDGSTTPTPRLDPAFGGSLVPFLLETLEADPATIYGLTEGLVIGYLNPAYVAFAHASGTSWAPERFGLGCQVMDVVPEPLRIFYADLFDRARQGRAPVEHTYQCSTPRSLRWFRMRVAPCRAGSLLVIHSLVSDVVHPAGDGSVLESTYRDANGLITQCSHCRRVRRAGWTPESWDWIAEYVERAPADSSHGLCKLCSDYYYPE